jgi:hypothetical protein
VVAIVMMLAGLAAFGFHLFLPESAAPYAVGAVLASGLWLSYVLMLQTGGVMSHVVGVLGEQWTADELRTLRRRPPLTRSTGPLVPAGRRASCRAACTRIALSDRSWSCGALAQARRIRVHSKSTE